MVNADIHLNYNKKIAGIMPINNIVFIDGPGGTGKTTIYRYYIFYLLKLLIVRFLEY
jgi:tRNA A37 threonylcarbamoyladenosine biosynthesis protein TsaE